jgi:two-component system aerobic respiration control sensor histidine kinase ArcB
MHRIPDEAVKFFEVLDRSVQNLDETIRSLNSTISLSVDPKVDKEEVDVKRLLSKIIESLAFDIQETRTTFDCNCEGAPLIWSDKALLESIVMNLITNAIKYRSADRNPHIQVSTTAMGNGYVLKVKDNGRGIDLQRHGGEIFGMFKTFNAEGQGQGIGLYLTRNQAEMMGGTVSVESTPDVGSTFTVYLPGNEQ